MNDSRQEAFERMIKNSENLGGNAVIGIRYNTSAIMSGASEVLAYGTAVLIEKE